MANHRNPCTDEIVTLTRLGVSAREIAERLDLTRSAVHGVIQSARKRGDLPRPTAKSARTVACHIVHARTGSKRLGRFAAIMDRLPPEVGRWLAHNTPDGATLADTATAIILDAYYDEQDEQD